MRKKSLEASQSRKELEIMQWNPRISFPYLPGYFHLEDILQMSSVHIFYIDELAAIPKTNHRSYILSFDFLVLLRIS